MTVEDDAVVSTQTRGSMDAGALEIRTGRLVIRDGAGVEAAIAACSDPKNHRYSPAGGLPELKEAIVAKTERDSGYSCEPGWSEK